MNLLKPTHHEIRVQAYYFWEQYGRPTPKEKSPVEIWFEAENFLTEVMQGVS